MKTVRFGKAATKDLRVHAGQARRIVAKIEEYARNGAGDIKELVGISGKRLRVGDYRVIFEETETEIVVTKIGPRGAVYD